MTRFLGLTLALVAAQIGLVTASQEAISLEQGAALYQEFCASCHGATLEGQTD
jgi:mono/diheme cytochrome c family protein